MVKILHPIGDIPDHFALVDEHRLRLSREFDDAPGPSLRDQGAQNRVAAVIRALDEPLDYPPLAAGMVPGDHVAIALEYAVPCAADIVLGVLQSLRRAGVEVDSISIVVADSQTAARCRDGLAGQIEPPPRIVVHDPDDADNLCLLGTTRRGGPLLVNRAIFDADIVLPIGVARVQGRGAYGGLYPWFSDTETISRYRTVADGNMHSDVGRLEETNEAGWLIGAPLVIQVVPGAGETVAAVLAGDPGCVMQRSAEISRKYWSLHSTRQVDLVIATITGGPESQTWTNVGRALAAVECLLTEAGAVAICSNLEELPGHSLGRLVGSNDLEKTERKIGRDHSEDSWPAWHLARAMQRGPVYFLSQLPAETIEDMGLAPVADLAELVRLAGRHESFAVIEDAQHAVITVDQPTDT